MVGRAGNPDDRPVADETATMTDERPPHDPPPLGPRRLTRSTDDRMLAGVCGGIADYLGVDTALVRVGFALLSLTGIGLVAYAVGWAVLPERGAAAPRWRPPWQLAAIAVGIWFLANWMGLWVFHGVTFPLALVLIGAVLVWGGSDGRSSSAGGAPDGPAASAPLPAPPPPPVTSTGTAVVEQTGPGRWTWSPPPPGAVPTPPPRPDRSGLGRAIAVGLGGILIAVGAVAAAIALSGAVAPTVTLGLAVAAFGATMAVGSWWGWARPLAAGGLLVVLALAVTGVVKVPLEGGVGDRLVRPSSIADLPATERLAVGALEIDLSGLRLTGDERHLAASVGLGELVVVVPDGVTVELHGEVGAGRIDAFELDEEGWTTSVDRTFEGRGPGRIELDLEVGIGHVEVRRG